MNDRNKAQLEELRKYEEDLGVGSYTFDYEKELVEQLEKDGFEIDKSYTTPQILIDLVPSLEYLVKMDILYDGYLLKDYMDENDYEELVEEFGEVAEECPDMTIEEWVEENDMLYELPLVVPNSHKYSRWKKSPYGVGYYTIF